MLHSIKQKHNKTQCFKTSLQLDKIWENYRTNPRRDFVKSNFRSMETKNRSKVKAAYRKQ